MTQIPVSFVKQYLKRIQQLTAALTGCLVVLLFTTKEAHASVLQEIGEGIRNTATLEATIHELSTAFAFVAGGIIILLTFISLVTQHKNENFKKFLFYSFTAATVLPTLFFTVSTVYVNVLSETKGPVHWHIDFEIHVCGDEVELIGPDGRFENKVGTPTFHHHVDKRIHVEGVVVDSNDVLLDDFFGVIGGELTSSSFTIPSTEGTLTVRNGDRCDDGSTGEWQAYLYRVTDGDESQATLTKLGPEFPQHLMYPHPSVPPGDCVVFEFGPPSETTSNICEFWEISEEKGDITITR